MSLANSPRRLRFLQNHIGTRWTDGEVVLRVYDVRACGEALCVVEGSGVCGPVPIGELRERYERIDAADARDETNGGESE